MLGHEIEGENQLLELPTGKMFVKKTKIVRTDSRLRQLVALILTCKVRGRMKLYKKMISVG